MAYGASSIVPAEKCVEAVAGGLVGVDLVTTNRGAARAIMVYPAIDSGSDWVTAIPVSVTLSKSGSPVTIPLSPGVLYPISVRKLADEMTADSVYLFW